MQDLNNSEKTVLQLLDGHGGYETGYLALVLNRPADMSSQRHSAGVRKVLLSLESRGMVHRLEGVRPACWVKS